MTLRILVVGDMLLERNLSDLVVSRAIWLYKKLNEALFYEIFVDRAPIVVVSDNTGRQIAPLLEESIMKDRASEEGMEGLRKGLATTSDTLAYLMDASLNINLKGDNMAIYRWLYSKVRERLNASLPSKEPPPILEPHQREYLLSLRRRILAYQLDFLEKAKEI